MEKLLNIKTKNKTKVILEVDSEDLTAVLQILEHNDEDPIMFGDMAEVKLDPNELGLKLAESIKDALDDWIETVEENYAAPNQNS